MQIDRNKMQLFLTIMDTIHDFSNINRLKEKKADDEAEEEFNDDLENVSKDLGSSAFLIDVLMLGLFKDTFRTVIGLDLNKNYVKTNANCKEIKHKNTNVFNYKPDALSQKICKEFYLPTFENRILYRSEKPEELTMEILFAYLKNSGQSYEVIRGSIDKHMSDNASCLQLDIGNKGVKESATRLKYLDKEIHEAIQNWDTKHIPDDPYKYKTGNKKGQLRDEYLVYKCDLRYDDTNRKVYFKEIKPSGIYAHSDMSLQSETLYNYLKKFWNNTDLFFLLDANQADNKWFHNHVYKGLFVKFDSASSDKNDTNTSLQKQLSKELHPNVLNNISFGGKTGGNGNKTEFQSYFLEKEKNELLLFDKLGCFNERGVDKIQYFYKTSIPYTVDLNASSNNTGDNKNLKTGLPLFMLFINEINKKTMGYKNITRIPKETQQNLIDTTKNLALRVIEQVYQLTVKFTKNDIKDKSDFLQLTPYDFVYALFDIKRSMDYLFVKACYEANRKEADEKYVFVSQDRSAICYSLLLGNPTILTPPVATTENGKNEKCQRGQHYLVLYNPPASQAKNSQVKNKTQVQNQVRPQPSPLRLPQNAINNAEAQNAPQNANSKTKRLMNVAAQELDLDIIAELPVEDDNNKLLYKNCQEFLKLIERLENGEIIKGRLKDPYGTSGINQSNKKRIETTKKSCAKHIDKYPEYAQMVGGDGAFESSILKESVPLKDFDTWCEEGSPMYVFFQFYSQLTPTVSFFWFITFKSLLFFAYGDDMDKANCAKFMAFTEKPTNASRNNSKTNTNPTRSQLNSVPPEFMLIRNNSSIQQQQQEQVQTPNTPRQQTQVNNNTNTVKNTNSKKSLRRDWKT